MANTQAMCRQFMIDLMAAKHAFMTTVTRGATTKDTFKGALYLTTATVDATTTAYSATGEVGNSGSYSAGGIAFTNATDPAGSGTAANGTGNKVYWTPSASWTTGASFTSSGAFDAILIYNSSTAGSPAVSVHTFGTQNVTAGTFTLTMPTNDGTTGLIRFGT